MSGDVIKKLVAKYESEKAAGRLKNYSEEETKKGFIEPLFTALGWDISDKNEVTAEESISSKRVDYGFYLDGHARFYLEAKAAKADIQEEKWADQAVRYSWNKGVTWAVLTNFERLIVFNAQDIERSLADKQLFDIPYSDFAIDERVMLLSKDAIAKNELDAYAEKYGKKFKRVPVSAQLYKDLNEARELLTKELGAWNPELKKNPDILDEGVQRLLDRLIFIRVAEDRGVEPQTLIPLVREWESSKTRNQIPLFQSMVAKFRELDEVYNSNLFKEHAFERWDDGTGDGTKGAIQLLEGKRGYYEYDFKVMPADVLGTVYEQYLGHRLSKSKKGLALDKDAGKRKEQGIYYTPTFVVDYIVKHALNPVLDRCKTIEDLRKIKVLDPACGSGSFLIKALEVLYKKYVELGEPEGEGTKLTILTTNLYGVDLDEQAVEIARLNLLINALDSRVKLPTLTNIRCGNSLISGTEAELKKYFGPSYRDKKPFNWQDEFPDVFKQGGFDVVIGNPPYINAMQLTESAGEDVKKFWKEKFETAKKTYDIYVLFFEQSLKICREAGRVAFITPNKYLSAPYGEALRKLIIDKYTLDTVLDLSTVKVFDSPSVYPIVTVLSSVEPNGDYEFSVERALSDRMNENLKFNLNSNNLRMMPEYVWGTILSENINIVEKIFNKSVSLEDVAEVQATSTAAEADEFSKYINNDKIGIPIINTGTIDRYSTTYGQTTFKNKSEQLKEPYLDLSKINPKRKDLYTSPKIIIAKLALRIEGFFDSKGKYASINTNCIHSPKKGYSLEYLAAIVNSRLISFVYSEIFSGLKMGGGYFQFQAPQLRILPVAKTSADTQKNLAILVKEIADLYSEFNSVEENSNEWERLKSELEKKDKKIDAEIYRLYGLTEEEIKLIEGKSSVVI